MAILKRQIRNNLSVKQENSRLWRTPGVDGFLSASFSIKKLTSAINQVKSGEAQGTDNIPPEFLKHCGPKCLAWLKKFYSAFLSYQSIPKIWRKATVVAVSKPNKPIDDPRSYHPISLLCVPYKILEWFLLARIDPVVDPQLPEE